MNQYFVYILECKDNRLYAGYTTDLDRRYQEHCQGQGSKFTRSYPPIKIAASWHLENGNVSDALKLELAIKKLSKQQKLKIIQENWNLSQLFDYFNLSINQSHNNTKVAP